MEDFSIFDDNLLIVDIRRCNSLKWKLNYNTRITKILCHFHQTVCQTQDSFEGIDGWEFSCMWLEQANNAPRSIISDVWSRDVCVALALLRWRQRYGVSTGEGVSRPCKPIVGLETKFNRNEENLGLVCLPTFLDGPQHVDNVHGLSVLGQSNTQSWFGVSFFVFSENLTWKNDVKLDENPKNNGQTMRKIQRHIRRQFQRIRVEWL